MCRRKYFFINHNQIQYYKEENLMLNVENINLHYEIKKLFDEKMDKNKIINDINFNVINKEIKIKCLMGKIEELSLILENYKNNEDLEMVIKKYHLNII